MVFACHAEARRYSLVDEVSTAMIATKKIVDEIRAALHSEPRFGLEGRLGLTYRDGTLTMEGEVSNVAAKKLFLERAAAHPKVSGILDRLRVAPTQRMGDDQIRQHLRDALLNEPAFQEHAIFEMEKGRRLADRDTPIDTRGYIEIMVEDGVVTINGQVKGLEEKCLAGVLAWWVPGSRDVINGIAVTPPEELGSDIIAEAVRTALEKDPFVDASQVRIGVKRGDVTLSGIVPTPTEREMAEFDAWYVFGVDRVTNKIEVRS
jgi:osmotically-inducible protein OsmY